MVICEGWWHFENRLTGSIIAKEWFVGNHGLFISVSLHLRLFPFALYLFEYHYSFNPLSLLSYHLSCSLVNMSILHSILLLLIFSLSLLFSLFYLPTFLSLCSSTSPCPPLPPSSFSQIKSWVLSPPLSLKESCNPGGSTGEMDPSSLCLSVVEAERETILSPHPSPLAGQRSDQHDPPPPSSTSQPVSRFTACYFSRWRKKARQRDGQKLGTCVEKEDEREGWFRSGVKESSILHFPSCSDTVMSPGCDVWDTVQCRRVHLSRRTELSALFSS